MSNGKETLKERLKARKQQRLRDTCGLLSDRSDNEVTTEVEMGVTNPEIDAMEAGEEQQESEDLVKDLKRNRKKVQQKLTATLQQKEAEDDVGAEMSSAKKKTRQRLREEMHIDVQSDAESAEDKPPLTDRPPSGRSGLLSPTPMSDEGSIQTPRRRSEALSHSLRMRLSQKIRAAKDRGKDEAYDETRPSGRRLAGIRNVSRMTRFDDPSMMRDEDIAAEEAVIRSMARRKVAVTSEQSDFPSEQQAYDFFTHTFEQEFEDDDTTRKIEGAATAEEGTPAEEPIESAEQPEKIEEAEEELKDGEQEPLLLDESEDSWLYYELRRAQYTPFRRRMEKERDIYFYPSIVAATTEKKLSDKAARFAEEEGLYVGVRPAVLARNLNKMENRLLQQTDGGAGWFGEDGRLIALPDPLKDVPSRPPIVEELEPELATVFRKSEMREFDSRLIGGSVEDGDPTRGRYQLDVDVNSLIFTHHHLFSREHVLASRLTQQFIQYTARVKRQPAQHIKEKLDALKLAALHVQDTITTLKKEQKIKAIENQEHRLADYRDEIKQTRRQWEAEMKADRLLLKNIIKTWKDIRALRQLQNTNNTSVKLVIVKEEVDKVADERELEQDITDELEELRHEFELNYDMQRKAFKEAMHLWKEQKIMKKEAHRRQKAKRKLERSRSRSRGRGETDEEDLLPDDPEQDQQDQLILDEDDLPKPVKPEPFLAPDVKSRIRGKFDEIRRKPGEPKLRLQLSNGCTVTPINQCAQAEQQRRNEVNRCKVFVRVLFNKMEVSRTKPKAIGQDFVVSFARIFNTEIVRWPESITLQVYETYGLRNTLLSEVYLPIPEAHVTALTAQLDELDFSSDQRQRHAHEAVGSGVPFSLEGDDTKMIQLMTCGRLLASVSWAVGPDNVVMVPPSTQQVNQVFGAMKRMDAVAAIGLSGMADMDKLTKWIVESKLDPNDPANADIMYLLMPDEGHGEAFVPFRLPEHFRLEQLQEEFNFATDEELDKSRRFRMIQYREREVLDFKGKVVPAYDREVPDDVFQEYEKKLKEEQEIKQLDELASHRAAVAKFMQKVREEVMLRFRIAAHHKVLSDMVYEDAYPDIGTIVPSLIRLTQPRRPLRPVRKKRKKMTAQNLQAADVKVLVNVVRAYNIPVRADAVKGPEQVEAQSSFATTQQPVSSGSKLDQPNQVLVRPFVEVLFQDKFYSTSVADGPNPCWNEELQVSFKAPNNDYSASNLQTLGDVLYFSLFDEYVTDVTQSDSHRGASFHRHVEKHWLGSLVIPFSTIYFNARIDGTFHLKKPDVLLGYTQSSGKRGDIDTIQAKTDDIFLTLFVTIEPPLAPAEKFQGKFDSHEDEHLLTMAETWTADLKKKFPKRDFKNTVIDINGKSVFMTRYFKPLKPPEELLNNNSSPEVTVMRVARFVSLIPFASDSVVFSGLCEIWSTCDQFLQMLQGDEEEHAVLLVNYFLHLSKMAWLILGSAIPEGPTAYVLTLENDGHRIWNASTGEYFSARDTYCPLQSINLVVSPTNIWANIQQTQLPSRMSFDFTNTTHWKPFFNKSNPHPGITSVQPESLLYYETEPGYVRDLQEKIETTLRHKIMEWRPQWVTRWNRYCIKTFRTLLTKLEETRGKGVQEYHCRELQKVLGSYKLSGFPMNFASVEMKSIVEAVYATEIHNCESKDIEFALAVHIHPYPNSVLSIWVYLASLVRKR